MAGPYTNTVIRKVVPIGLGEKNGRVLATTPLKSISRKFARHDWDFLKDACEAFTTQSRTHIHQVLSQ